MKEYKIVYRAGAEHYYNELALYISQQTSVEYALQYLQNLRKEVERLSLIAGMLPKDKYRMPKRYHKDAQTMSVGKHKFTVIFHIEGDYVVVDKIMPSSMITY